LVERRGVGGMMAATGVLDDANANDSWIERPIFRHLISQCACSVLLWPIGIGTEGGPPLIGTVILWESWAPVHKEERHSQFTHINPFRPFPNLLDN
jgi:hypothetical protein